MTPSLFSIRDALLDSMHPCLQIDEILQLITTNIERGSALVAMASTSRGFYEHAVNEIWKELSDLVPLVKCLPSDAYEYHSRPALQIVSTCCDHGLMTSHRPCDRRIC